MTSIGVAIFAYNNELEIKETIASAKHITDEITVIDMESADETAGNARKAGATVLSFPHTPYVEPAREFGIQNTPGDWVFILDADERIPKELGNEVKANVHENTYPAYFRVPRKNIFGRKVWLRHGGWWPDAQIRLIKKSAFRRWPKEIHSTPVISGPEGMLDSPLLHYFHGDLGKMVEKTAVFEDIESELLYKAGKKVSTFTFFRKFTAELYRRLIRDRGYRDGRIGIMESIYQAYSKTVTYLFLYEKSRALRPVS